MDGSLKKYEDLTTFKSDLESILGVESNEKSPIKNNIFNFNKLLNNNDSKTEGKV